MKIVSFVLNIVLLFAVGLLYYLHFSTFSNNEVKENESKISISDSMPLLSNYSKIVFINSDTLMEKYLYVKDMRKELEAEKSKLEGQFEFKYKQLEKEYEEFRQKAPYMSEEVGKQKQLELMEKEQHLGQYKDELSLKLMDSEQKKNEELYRILEKSLSRYNQENTTHFVLGYKMGGGILFANDSLDITDEIIEGLNKEYQSTGK